MGKMSQPKRNFIFETFDCATLDANGQQIVYGENYVYTSADGQQEVNVHIAGPDLRGRPSDGWVFGWADNGYVNIRSSQLTPFVGELEKVTR